MKWWYAQLYSYQFTWHQEHTYVAFLLLARTSCVRRIIAITAKMMPLQLELNFFEKI